MYLILPLLNNLQKIEVSRYSLRVVIAILFNNQINIIFYKRFSGTQDTFRFVNVSLVADRKHNRGVDRPCLNVGVTSFVLYQLGRVTK